MIVSKTPRWPIVLTIALIAALVLTVSCGGAAPTPTPIGPDNSEVAREGLMPAAPISDGATEKTLTDIYREALPSLVYIRLLKPCGTQDECEALASSHGIVPPLEPGDLFLQGEGSGFVWDNRGHILTNNHVVDEAERIVVVFANGLELNAEVVGNDPDSDLAVLKVDLPPSELFALPSRDCAPVSVGQHVVAIGNPFGYTFSMTQGIVSGVERAVSSRIDLFPIPGLIQIDARLNPGNSGGPLLNLDGCIIGIGTLLDGRSGFGFAVPISTAKRIVPVLIEEGSYDHPWLGVAFRTLHLEDAESMDLAEDARGVLITAITPGASAEKAGLMVGDLLVAINGTPVEGNDWFSFHLTEYFRPGDRVLLAVIRDHKLVDVEATLGKRPR